MLLKENITIGKECFKSSLCTGMRRWFTGEVLIKMGNEEIRWRKIGKVVQIRTRDISYPLQNLPKFPLPVQLQCFQVWYLLPGFCHDRVHVTDKTPTGCTWPSSGERASRVSSQLWEGRDCRGRQLWTPESALPCAKVLLGSTNHPSVYFSLCNGPCSSCASRHLLIFSEKHVSSIKYSVILVCLSYEIILS